MSGTISRATRVVGTDARVEGASSSSPPRDAPRQPGSSELDSPDGAVSLGELLRRTGDAVRAGVPGAMWVVAAVSAVKPARGGASIELVEAEAAKAESGLLRAYLPDNVLAALRQRTGLAVAAADLAVMTVVVRMSVDFSGRWGLSGRILALGPGIEQSLAKRALEAAIVRLRRDGLLDRQSKLAAPRDITRIAVVHPAGAAGWADIAVELRRWERAGIIAFRSYPTPFEGAGAAAGIATVLRQATEPLAGKAPDVVLVVRGGGAAASLAPLDDEALARAIATLPIPVVAGLGHAVDRTLADRVVWRTADTPSKALHLVRDLMVAPARRARIDREMILAHVASGIEREVPRLLAVERRVTAETLRQTVDASAGLDRTWSTVRSTAGAARERLGRLDDGLLRTVAGVNAAAPMLVVRGAAGLEAIMATVRVQARRASETAEDSTRLLGLAGSRAVSQVAAAEVTLAALRRSMPAVAAARLDRAASGAETTFAAVQIRARERLHRAHDGTQPLAHVEAAVREAHRRHEAVVARLGQAIETAILRRLDAAAAALDRDAAILDGADPVAVLARGYVLVTDPSSGRPVTSLTAARAAASLTLIFADGSLSVVTAHPQTQPQGPIP